MSTGAVDRQLVDEAVVLERLADPATRWHTVTALAWRTRRRPRRVRQALARLSERRLATGPPFQPRPEWSVTTLGAAVAFGMSIGVELERAADLVDQKRERRRAA